MGNAFLKYIFPLCLVALSSGCAAPTGPVQAIGSIDRHIGGGDFAEATSSPLPDGGEAMPPPPGFVAFCVRMPDQCTIAPGSPRQVEFTPDLQANLLKVNRDVNDSIWPENDERHYHVAEYWTIPTDGYGDCEDYALAKKQRLMAAGLSPAALRIAVVVTRNEERHAVLTVSTDKGAFILDNLHNDILPWSSAGYAWVSGQDPSNAMAWDSFKPMQMAAGGPGNSLTGSNR